MKKATEVNLFNLIVILATITMMIIIGVITLTVVSQHNIGTLRDQMKTMQEQIENNRDYLMYNDIDNAKAVGYYINTYSSNSTILSMYLSIKGRYSEEILNDLKNSDSSIRWFYEEVVIKDYSTDENIYEFVRSRTGYESRHLKDKFGLNYSQTRGLFYQLVLLRQKALLESDKRDKYLLNSYDNRGY